MSFSARSLQQRPFAFKNSRHYENLANLSILDGIFEITSVDLKRARRDDQFIHSIAITSEVWARV
jgi:hypothetical protein